MENGFHELKKYCSILYPSIIGIHDLNSFYKIHYQKITTK